MRFIIVLCAVLACAAAAAGDVYKWKDKDGRVHYGDKPKTGEAEAIMVTPSNEEGDDPAAAAQSAARAAECQQKSAQLAAWRKAPTMSEVDNLGRTREYTPAERQQFLEMTQAKVDALCAPSPSTASGTFPPPEEKYEPVQPPPDESAPAPKKKP
jgi:hypothetical protein